VNDVLGELRFEVGDAPVQEAAGGAGGVDALAQCAVLVGELADALVQGVVLRGEELGGVRAEGVSRSRSVPASSPIRRRWVRISVCAWLRASSAFSARSLQEASACPALAADRAAAPLAAASRALESRTQALGLPYRNVAETRACWARARTVTGVPSRRSRVTAFSTRVSICVVRWRRSAMAGPVLAGSVLISCAVW
jgi:hypothetical protein